MPIYEYRCQTCGHEFEKLQRISDRPIKKCPDCGGATEKLFSLSSFSLTGGGWYSDGYSKGGKKPAASSDSSKSDTTKDKGKKASSSASSD